MEEMVPLSPADSNGVREGVDVGDGEECVSVAYGNGNCSKGENDLSSTLPSTKLFVDKGDQGLQYEKNIEQGKMSSDEILYNSRSLPSFAARDLHRVLREASTLMDVEQGLQEIYCENNMVHEQYEEYNCSHQNDSKSNRSRYQHSKEKSCYIDSSACQFVDENGLSALHVLSENRELLMNIAKSTSYFQLKEKKEKFKLGNSTFTIDSSYSSGLNISRRNQAMKSEKDSCAANDKDKLK